MLLQAARSNTAGVDEKSMTAVEDPGMDTLRGSFGAMGSIIRARSARRMSMSSNATGSTLRARHGSHSAFPGDVERPHYNAMGHPSDHLAGMKRHQLYDPPVPGSDAISLSSQMSPRSKQTTIKFGAEDIVHQYPLPGRDSGAATHEHRTAVRSPGGSGPGQYLPVRIPLHLHVSILD